MPIKLFKKKNRTFLLVVYVFLLVAGIFHYHPFSYRSETNYFISSQENGNSGNDFSDINAGQCLLVHFFQSISFDDDLTKVSGCNLTVLETMSIEKSFFIPGKEFYQSNSLRAPPTI